MCDLCDVKVAAWRGWVPLPEGADAPAPVRSTQPWVDLSHPIGSATPTMSVFEPPRVERILNLPQDPANITRISMVVHQGTHIDAPFHLYLDGPALDAIPLERFYGGGVIWRIEKEPFGVIEVADFEAARPAVQPGDIVFIDTGWSAHAHTPLYEQHPNLSSAAAQWLVEHRVKLLGVDFSTPDLSAKRRPKGFTWPVHQVLLGQGVLVAEHLTHLRALSNQRVEISCLPLNIAGSDGSPVRVVARALDA